MSLEQRLREYASLTEDVLSSVLVHDLQLAADELYRLRAAPIVTAQAVNRFLAWPLPKDFAPDCGIGFTPIDNPNCWPTGTNLFTAEQARAMLEYIFAESGERGK